MVLVVGLQVPETGGSGRGTVRHRLAHALHLQPGRRQAAGVDGEVRAKA